MARVTVEDCVDKTETRFELVMCAAQRARKIGSGAVLTVDRDNDKNTVVSLREIAAETIEIEDMKEELTRSHQRMAGFDEEDDEIDLMDGEEEWEKMARAAAIEERGDAAPQGIYSDEEIGASDDSSPESAAAPSLEDLAGTPTE